MMTDMREFIHGGMKQDNPGPEEVIKPGISYDEKLLPVNNEPIPSLANMQEFTYSSAFNVKNDSDKDNEGRQHFPRLTRGGAHRARGRGPRPRTFQESVRMRPYRPTKRERNQFQQERFDKAQNRAKDAASKTLRDTAKQLNDRQIPLTNRFQALVNDPVETVAQQMKAASVSLQETP